MSPQGHCSGLCTVKEFCSTLQLDIQLAPSHAVISLVQVHLLSDSPNGASEEASQRPKGPQRDPFEAAGGKARGASPVPRTWRPVSQKRQEPKRRRAPRQRVKPAQSTFLNKEKRQSIESSHSPDPGGSTNSMLKGGPSNRPSKLSALEFTSDASQESHTACKASVWNMRLPMLLPKKALRLQSRVDRSYI